MTAATLLVITMICRITRITCAEWRNLAPEQGRGALASFLDSRPVNTLFNRDSAGRTLSSLSPHRIVGCGNSVLIRSLGWDAAVWAEQTLIPLLRAVGAEVSSRTSPLLIEPSERPIRYLIRNVCIYGERAGKRAGDNPPSVDELQHRAAEVIRESLLRQAEFFGIHYDDDTHPLLVGDIVLPEPPQGSRTPLRTAAHHPKMASKFIRGWTSARMNVRLTGGWSAGLLLSCGYGYIRRAHTHLL